MDLRHLSKKGIVEKRCELYHLLNGDVFYQSKNWPKDTLSIFWKKPIGDLDTFKLMLFFIGNGCSPHVISEWILSSLYWAEPAKWDKRKRQIDFIYLTNRFHVAVRLFSNRSQMTTQCGKNKKALGWRLVCHWWCEHDSLKRIFQSILSLNLSALINPIVGFKERIRFP